MNDVDRRRSDLLEKRRRLLDALTREQGARRLDLNRIPRRADRASAPLSFAQTRLWFLNQYYPDSPIYNMSTQLPLVGPVNVAAIGRALNEIVDRHEALRTTFRTESYQPVQVIAPKLHLEVPLHDLTGVADAERQAAALEIVRLEGAHIFDLSAGPLLRAALIRLDEQVHYLILTMHHITSDGWSMTVLSREFSLLYEAFAAGRPSPLPPLEVHYADFAVWQRAWLEREGLEAQMPYWRTQLADVASTILELPSDRPRPLAQSFRGSSVYFTFPASLSEKLRTLSHEAGATPFMTLLSGFKALLYRYTGQSTLVVGFPTAGRNRTELEALIGFFVNSLPLRTDISGTLSFRQLIGRVKDVTLGALANQDMPFERIVEELQVPRMLNANPVFQIMFDMHTQASLPGGDGAPAQEDEECMVAAGGNGTSKFDLSLSMLNDGSRFSGSFEYSSDLFDEATIVRLVGHFEALLKGAVANPDIEIDRLPLLTEKERRRQLHDFNDTVEAFPEDLCLHQVFELQARRTPEAPAVVHGGAVLTYAELNRRANRLARHLRDAGIGPERIVGICMEGSLELVVAILGVLKAGGAYLPLDATYPRDRLAFMVEDAGVELILVEERLRTAAAGLAPKSIALGGEADPTRDHDDGDLPTSSDPANAAYVIYTSGSTGRPKGVVVPHPGVVNMLQSMARIMGIGPGRRVLHFNSFSFDISVFELFGPLLTGATLHVERRDAMVFGDPLARTLRDNAITTVTLSPSAWAHLPPTSFPDLYCAISGGAACTAAVVSRWAPGRTFYNAYGPTETTVASSAIRCLPDGTKPTIGKPFGNMRYYVVDRNLEPVPVGVPGELLIGGVGLARGYFRQPALTAERFIPDPFSGCAGGRLYRTGDLVRQLPNGEIDFLGRIDDQVEIRGFRIELGEIEAVLQSAPGVGNVAVTCQVDPTGNKRIIAYAVPGGEGPAATAESTRQHLAERLPEYMMPATIVLLDHIPLTPAGKVDRRALPSPDALRRQGAYRAPRSPLEHVVLNIFAECLQIEGLGIDDNFFEAGGHSLLATQVVSRLRDTFKIDLPVRAVFESPTAAQLSAFLLSTADDRERFEKTAALFQQVAAMDDRDLDALLEAAGDPQPNDAETRSPAAMPAPVGSAAPAGRISARADRATAPLSFAQERLWFLAQYSPESPAYNTLAPLPLPEPVNIGALQRSLTEMVRRHESLRTTFRVIDGAPAQVIDANAAAGLVVKDYRNAPPDEGAAAAAEIIKSEALRPFDLERGPLLRVLLIRPAAGPSLLVVVMHHIISDAWSRRIFFHDLLTLYQAFCLGQPSPLTPLPVQYADFAAWQREALQGAALSEKLSYWTRQLADAPAFLELPTDRPRPLTDLLNSAMLPVAFPADLVSALHRLGRQEGATMFMTMLAAFMVLLHRYTGHARIPVGSPIANRDRTEIEGVIGFFTNTLVLCGDLTGAPTFRTFLRRVREMAIGSFANQDLPFEKLVEAINPPRSHQVNPLFQVMFVLQKETGAFLAPTEDMSAVWGEGGDDADRQAGGIAKFDLMVYLEEGSAGLFGGIEYATDLFDRATIERLGRHFGNLLHAIVDDPDAKISSLELISSEERSLLFGEWTEGPLEPNRQRTGILEQFAAQVARAPDAIAVRSEDRVLSYATLDEAANHLAHRLIGAGVRPDDPVGVALRRGPQLMLALLAVLKAGGAYLALDPELPPERLAFVVADANPAAVVTEAALAGPWQDGPIPCLVVDAEDGAERAADPFASRRADPPVSTAGQEHAAYIIYTSGSTGTPKGVVLSHGVLADLVEWQCLNSALPAGSRTLQFSSPSFDVFLQETFATWCAGGELVCLSDDERRDPAVLARRVAEHDIRRVFLPYVALQQMADAVARNPPAGAQVALAEIVTAGEQLIVTPEIVALISATGGTLINQYGPSETHVVSQHSLSGIPNAWPSLPPIGRPAAGAQLYVLDDRLQPVPPGAIGELCVGGAAVGRGYLRRPALTADRFLPDPFSGIPGARMYRTGDLVRHRADGAIDFLGRRDGQVKIRGFRVELGEIEAALLGQPDIAEAVVVVQAGTSRDARFLVAYVVPAAGQQADARPLREALRRKLPDYMIPARIIRLDALPLTATGKVDRLRLPMSVPGDTRPDLAQQYVAPRSALEQKLAVLWAEVLGVAEPGIHDNFFELGGHSLLGTQLVSRIRGNFGVDLPLRTLFDAPTIAGLALEIVQIKAAAQAHDPRVIALLADLEQATGV